MPLGMIETFFINPLIYYIMLHTIIVIAAIVAAVAGISLLSGINNSLKVLREGLKALDLSVRDRHEVYRNRDDQNRRLMGDMINILGRMETEEKAFLEQHPKNTAALFAALAEVSAKLSGIQETENEVLFRQNLISDNVDKIVDSVSIFCYKDEEEPAEEASAEEAEEPAQPEEAPAEAAVEVIVNKNMPVGERYAAMKKRLDEGANIQQVAEEFGYSCVRNARRFMRNHEKNAKK